MTKNFIELNKISVRTPDLKSKREAKGSFKSKIYDTLNNINSKISEVSRNIKQSVRGKSGFSG